MEDQVAQASLAMVSPTTDGATRRQASQFLEQWTKLPEAWDVYVKWLGSFRSSPAIQSNGDQIAMQLLCLTMLQTKIRKEIPRNDPSKWHPSISLIRQELWEYARLTTLDKSLIMPCCICNAAIIVRCGILSDFISHIGNDNSKELSPFIVLRLVACIPSEMEACQDLSPSRVTQELVPHLEIVLDTIRHGLVFENSPTILPACQALKEWSNISHLSLTQLNTPTCGGHHAVLPTLISILSTSTCNDERLLEVASQALTAAIMVVSDHCSTTRDAAASLMWNAIPHGFIAKPLHLASQNEWHNACYALATLICTFVTEQADDLVSQPADIGLQLLLDIQAHPHIPVAIIPLDCWLAIQDIPSNERHEHWRKPLFRKVVQTLLSRMAYPATFTNWQDELELDSSEFQELRRMTNDVLVSSYLLLRVELIQMLTNHIRTAKDWTSTEAALVCLSQISREVCSRCKSNMASGKSIARDRDATCQELIQLLDQLVGVNIATGQHPVLSAAIINFCGSYSPAWNSMDCPPEAILKLLSFLQSAFISLPLESAKATRAIYVSCLSKTMPNLDDIQNPNSPKSPTILPMVLKSVRSSMEAVLSTTDEDAMTTVAEGATRLVTKLKDISMAKHGLVNDLIRPVLNRGQPIVHRLPTNPNAEEWSSPDIVLAMESLMRYLSVIQMIVRFCDVPHIPTISEWLLQEFGPFLEATQRQIAASPAQSLVLPKWIGIQQQLLRNAPPQSSIVIGMFSNTIPFIVQALEHTQDPSTLKYISSAVEMFGGKTDEMDHSFKELLSHVTSVVTSQNNLTDATELLQSYFECLQRFILYCPRALCYNPQFRTILTLTVESISALKGAKESTRAALLFLSQLFGWNLLRLMPHVHQVLQEAWHMVLAEMLAVHGFTLTQSCVTGLAGGPQMLWPAYSDCLFAITQSILNNPKPDTVNGSGQEQLSENLIQQWLITSMSSTVASEDSAVTMTADICNQIITILFSLALKGTKGRAKAKMLLSDFAKLSKGEMTPDVLLSYAISSDTSTNVI